VTVQTQIPLARPEIGERERALVAEVLASGRLSLGPMLERFETEFATFVGTREAVAVSSGTAALHLAVRAAGWGPGDEVVTSPFSFVASANCLLYEQIEPVFCDIDARTLNIDPAAAEAACGEHTAGVLPVDIFGYPADLPTLVSLAQRKEIGIVEDACEALGAVDAEGVNAGARKHMAAFAFYANKQLTTGEGGMLTGGDAGQRALARSERNQGRAPDMGWVDHERLGFNYRLSDVAAAIGVGQIERLAQTLERRSAVASLYREGLAELEGLVLPCEDVGAERRSWFVFVVQVPAECDRDAVIDRLAEAGIASKAYLPCIHLQPLYRERFAFRGGEFPVAERVAGRSLALPFYPAMEESQVAQVCTALRAAIGR
jgi:perosamine synthetase